MLSFSLALITSKNEYFILSPPFWEYYADPFFLNITQENYVVIFERYSRISRKGRIAVVDINMKDRCYKIYDLLDEKHHLSYPCPIKIDKKIFIIPESSQSKNLSLYRIIKLINKFTVCKINSIDGIFIDATYYHDKNKYLLYYDGKSNNDGNLFKQEIIFSLSDEMAFHGERVLVSNLRPGGKITNNFQPFQNNSGSYGDGLVFISDDRYQEPLRSSKLNPYFDLLAKYSHHVHLEKANLVFDYRESSQKGVRLFKRVSFGTLEIPNDLEKFL